MSPFLAAALTVVIIAGAVFLLIFILDLTFGSNHIGQSAAIAGMIVSALAGVMLIALGLTAVVGMIWSGVSG